MSNPEGNKPEFLNQDFADRPSSLEGQQARIIKEKLGITGKSEPLPEDFAEQTNHNDPGLVAKAKVQKAIERIRKALFS